MFVDESGFATKYGPSISEGVDVNGRVPYSTEENLRVVAIRLKFHTERVVKIFYSWQSDLPNSTNRGFIQRALERAAQSIGNDPAIAVEPVVDRDTTGVPGSPDIADTIFEKIDSCQVFVCDVSIINPNDSQRPTPNPNVLLELGFALKRLGWSYIIMIFNSAFSPIEGLPFDLRTKRVTVYSVQEDDSDKAEKRHRLESQLETALQQILQYRDHAVSRDTSIENSGQPTEEVSSWRDQTRAKALESSVNRLNRGAVSASVEVWQDPGRGRKEGSSKWPERIPKICGTE